MNPPTTRTDPLAPAAQATTPPQARRAPRKDAAENRVAILAAAASALNIDPDASLETIASVARLSRRALYGHFANREELVGELLTAGARRVTAALLHVDDPDPLVRIAQIGARLWDEVEDVRVMAQLAVRGPLRDRVADALRPLRDMLLETVQHGIEAGRLRQDMDAATLARLVEGAALDVLDEATRSQMSRAEGHRLVMLNILGCVGLSWKQAAELIANSPVLSAEPAMTR